MVQYKEFKIDSEVLDALAKLKGGKILGCRFVLSDDFSEMLLEEGSVIELSDAENAFEKLVEGFEPNDCKLAAYDAKYAELGGGNVIKSKLMAITWCPNEAPIRKKMTYSTKGGDIKKILEIEMCLQMNDSDDKDISSVINKVCQKKICTGFQGREVKNTVCHNYKYKD